MSSLLVMMFTCLSLLAVFQNCQPNPKIGALSDGSSDLNAYKHLSLDGQRQMLLAEDELRKADVNVHAFIDILDKVYQFMVFANQNPPRVMPPADTNTPVAQQVLMENLAVQINQLGRFFDVLNSIPVLSLEQRGHLSKAIQIIESVQGLNARDHFLKAMVTLVELKQILIDKLMSVSETERQAMLEQGSTKLQAELLVIKNHLNGFIESMKVAKPSIEEDLNRFQQGFILFLEKVLQLRAQITNQ